MTNGRKTICDTCQKVKPDCLWITRLDSMHDYCLCANCRAAWTVYGVNWVLAAVERETVSK